MNKLGYDTQMREAKDEYTSKCKALRKEYVRSNSKVKTGDVLKDHIGSIRVEKAGVNIPITGYPEPKFYGPCLKIDGTPRKDKSHRWLYMAVI